MRCPCLCLCWVWDGDYVSQLHMCGNMLMLRAVFNKLVRNGSHRRPICFRCLIFSLSGPCVIFTLFYLLLDLSCSERDVIALYFMCCSVNVSVCLVC